jgi:hypothetical protein
MEVVKGEGVEAITNVIFKLAGCVMGECERMEQC